MIETSHTIGAPADRVFAVLADGWTYASWVVGAAHMRAVDAEWPAVGARLHHRIGPWPLHINDDTVVTAVEPGRMIELKANAWPLGAARVRVTLEPLDATTTRVHMEEAVTSGPGSLLPEPAQALLLRPRNKESLRRLDDIAVHRPG